jgi:hypothetical protein
LLVSQHRQGQRREIELFIVNIDFDQALQIG